MSLRGDHIAIVGMAGRFPGADSVDDFWRNLCDSVDSVEWRTPEELREAGVREVEYTSDKYIPASYSASDLDGFDPGFFGLTQREAEIKDPQHRLFLELSNTALEHAGYDHRRMTRRVGVFGGTANSPYREDYVYENAAVMRAAGGMSVSVGNYPDYVAPLVSYKFGFLGPSISIYTACSTSLAAVHLAAQSLRNGECDVALAGGAQVDLPLGSGYTHVEGSIYSADGHVRPFDANASGTIFSNGGGVVVLKLLEDAQRDGDTIHAVIRGSAVNNDGNDRAGFTAPGIHGQTELILDALSDAEVDPRTIGYLEAHGTGTVIGDPIELNAISNAYSQHTSERGFCALASLKGNVGHLGPAAGIASLIKAAYALREGVIPASINCAQPNPALELDKTPFRLQRETTQWISNGTPLRAAISSFGIGGTNAHAILERAPEPEPATPMEDESRPCVLPLSARSSETLEQMAADLASHLEVRGGNLADIAGTLQTGRGQHDYRCAVVATTHEEAIAALLRKGDSALTIDGRGGKQKEVAFLFPGQGAQYPGMGLGLYRTQPVYREALDRCAEVFSKLLDVDLLSLLHADASNPEAAARLSETRITQPVTFAVNWALAQLWQSWGIRPAVMLGHSVGEYVAATLAGVLELDDALKLVAARAALMQSLPRGSMLALPLDAEAVRPLLEDPELAGEVQLAASNSPSASVVSGTNEGVDKLREILADMGLEATLLRTSHAFHSQMMDPILEQFRELVASIRLSAPTLPYISNVTGDWILEQDATDPEYWLRHLRGEVRFNSGLDTLARQGEFVLLEVGAGQALSSFARQHAMIDGGQISAAQTLRSPNKSVDDEAFILAAASRLWASGVQLDWSRVTGRTHHKVPLPTYPYERRRCWVDPDPATENVQADLTKNEGTKPPLEAPWYVPVWAEAPLQRHRADNAIGETWLVITDNDRRGFELIEACRATGAFIVPVTSGFGFSNEGDAFVVDPDDATAMRELLEVAWASGQAPDRLLYATGVFVRDSAAGPALAQQTYDRLLHLAQGLARVVREELDLLVVTDRAHAVTGAESIVPYAATARGPVMAMVTELPGVSARHLDVQATDEQSRLVRNIVRELGQDDDEHVAVRGARRWVRAYRPIDNEPAEVDHTLLRSEGVYLITGGLGGLGLEIARDLATRYRARLILVGRSVLPAAEKWDAVLADPDADVETKRRILGVRELESLGSDVLVGAADAADETAMAEVVRTARERFGPINGVIHAAGLPGGAMMEIHSPEAAAPVLSPKTCGTVIIDRLCGEEADFIVLFSSVISVCGDYAHSDYTAANAFMDAFAAYRDGAGPYVVSINWPGWSEAGLVADGKLSQGTKELLRARSIPIGHPLTQRRYDDDTNLREYDSELHPEAHWVLTDHQLDGVAVMPGTALLEMVRAAVQDATGAEHIRLSEVIFIDPLAIKEATTVRIQFFPEGDNGWSFELTAHTTSGGSPRVYCRGRASVYVGNAPGTIDLGALRATLREVDISGLDESDIGIMTFGPRWAVVASYHHGENRGLVELTLPSEFHGDIEELVIHPGLLDRATSFGTGGLNDRNYLPFTYRSVTVLRPMPSHCWAVQQIHSDPQRADFLDVDVIVTDDAGQPCVLIEGYTMRAVTLDAAQLADAEGPNTLESPRGPSDRLRTVEGQEIFRRILALRPGSQVVVCPEGLYSRMARSRSFGTAELSKADNTFAVSQAPRTIDTPYIAPETEVQEVLSRLWGEALGMSEVGISDDFFAIGGSSLVAVQLIARIADRLSIRLSVADLFEYATVRSLADFVESRLIETLGQMSDEEAQAALHQAPA